MSPAVKLAAFAVVLVVVFGLGIGLGAAFGPSTGDDPASHDRHGIEAPSPSDGSDQGHGH